MLIPVISALVTILLVSAVILLLRTVGSSRITDGAPFEGLDLDYGPMRRLLDPAEFQYLKDRGISKDTVKKLRNQRRKLYRHYVKSIALEFSRVHDALKSLLVSSHSDRPDLVAFLMKQKFTFYQNIIRIEVRLTLHAFGVDEMSEIDLIPSLEALQAQFRQLVPVPVTVSVL